MLFCKLQQHMVPDYCTKYKQNQPILLSDITTNTQCKKKVPQLLKLEIELNAILCASAMHDT